MCGFSVLMNPAVASSDAGVCTSMPIYRGACILFIQSTLAVYITQLNFDLRDHY